MTERPPGRDLLCGFFAALRLCVKNYQAESYLTQLLRRPGFG